MGATKSKHLEITSPLNHWQIKGELGSGSYGKVHLVERRADRHKAAAKVADVELKSAEMTGFMNEINILAGVNHENVCGFVGAYFHDGKLWIVIECCPGGAVVETLTKRHRGMSEPQLQAAGAAMLSAIEHLHSMNIFYRDMNGSNTLLDGAGRIKLADFGISCTSTKPRGTFIGSPFWMAPEVIACETNHKARYTNKCDIWSLGITLIEFAQMKPPYKDLHPVKAMMKITAGAAPKLETPEAFSPQFSAFLAQILIRDPARRPSATELIPNPFVSGQNDHSRLAELLNPEPAPAAAAPAPRKGSAEEMDF